MSTTTSSNDGKLVDEEKSPRPVDEDVLSTTESPLARTLTTPAPLMELSKGLVGWESPHDDQNPINWPASKRRIDMTLICCITFLSPLGSSIFAPGIAATMKDLHESSESIGSLMITIYLLGYALGPLFLAPLSEMYGRYPVVIISTWAFIAFLLGCSFAPSMPALIILRLLAGTGGSAVMTIAPAMVADLYPIEQRSFAMGMVLLIQSISPAVGPICGGFIAQQLGWRWAYWILIMASALVTLLMMFFLSEPYAPAVLERKTKRLRKELGREDLQSKLTLQISKAQLLKRSLIRPVKLLTRSPVVALFSLYVASLYGILYLFFTTIPTIFRTTYGWTVEITGLVYLSFAVGMCLSLAILMSTMDKKVARLRNQNDGVFEPEMRLHGMVYLAVMTSPALIIYGWTLHYHVHWIVPILAIIPFAMGMVSIFVSTQTYIVDAFSKYAASAVAAVTCVRSFVGAFLPFAGPPLFGAVGVGWGNTILGFIALMLTPLMVIFLRYGRQVRLKYPVQL